MREIITIQVGQAGNQIGWRFWDVLQREHALAGGVASDAFFAEVDRGRGGGGILRARAVLIDSEEGVVSQLLRGPQRALIDPRAAVLDVSGAGNNWAHGYAVYGPHHGPRVMERVRLALEACDSPQAFLLLQEGGATYLANDIYSLNCE